MISEFGLWVTIMVFTGAIAGSFANVVIHRVPRMIHNPDPHYNLFLPCSSCPACGVKLRCWHNIPVFSWCLLRGRCDRCQARIGYHYPLTELLFIVTAALLACLLPKSLIAVMAILQLQLLWCLASIDLRYGLLPDMLTQPLIWSGLLCCIFGISNISLEEAVTGAMVGWLFLWFMYWLVFYSTGKEGLGYGDLKLLAGLGAWNGWEALPLILFFAACLTLLFPLSRLLQKREEWRDAYPFGPGLAASGGIYWLAKEII